MTRMEMVQPMPRAHAGDLVRRFVVPRQHVDLVAARRENFAAPPDSFAPRHLIAGRDVIIGLHAQHPFERLPIIMDVRENLKLHRKCIVTVAPAVLPPADRNSGGAGAFACQPAPTPASQSAPAILLDIGTPWAN